MRGSRGLVDGGRDTEPSPIGGASVELLAVGPLPSLRWQHGPVRSCDPTPSAVARALGARSEAEAVLVLDARFPPPAGALVASLLRGPADAWHAGLHLGQDGMPRLLEQVDPLSMLNAALDPAQEATSWRVSLRALLVRSTVIDQLGGPDPAMQTLAGAGLEVGYRWSRAGALLRHVPALVAAADAAAVDDRCDLSDEVRFIARHHGRVWAGWALARSVTCDRAPLRPVARNAVQAYRTPSPATIRYRTPESPDADVSRPVTVVIPTIDRYPYLVRLLGQLADQTIPPAQVVVVDQTPLERRRDHLRQVAPALPLEVVHLDRPGQSTARNTALRRATGTAVLFLDDDDEVPPTLIADHLLRLADGVDAICGAVDDASAGRPPDGFRHRRASDVFPTNNAMVRVAALGRSGLFDPVFDHGPRADHDLGMRLHLSGALSIYDPSVEVFHHHAPVGGLRTHGARRVTRASARRTVFQRQPLAMTEAYIGYRYFTAAQRRAGLAIRLVSTLSGDGPLARRAARAAVQSVLLPHTWSLLRRADREAARVAATAPPPPTLPDPPASAAAAR